MTTAINQRRIFERLTRSAVLCLLALAVMLCQAREAAAQQWTTNGDNISNTNTGNVGIGTTSPSALLQLQVNTGDVVNRFSNAGGVGGALDVRYKYESSQHRIGLSDNSGQWFFYTQVAPSNTNSIGFFPGSVGVGTTTPAVKLAVNGAGTNVYATDAWIENNMHVQGNEVLEQGGGRARMRVGTAWGYVGLYSEGSSVGRANDLILGSSTGTVRVGPGAAAVQNFIVPNGNVGVGVSAPAVKLAVNGAGANVYATDAWIENNMHVQGNEVLEQGGGRARMRVGTAWGYVGLYSEGSSVGRANDLILGSSTGTVRVGPGAAAVQNFIVPNGNVGIGTATPSAQLEVVGNLNATGTITGGTINAKYQDVAEWVPSTQKLAAGTVVVVDAGGVNHVLASASAYDTSVAGVVSEQPGLLLGEGGEGKVKVATTGRVKVRVDATRAPIRAGDLLVTSGALGVAMRSEPISVSGITMHRPGTIIGKALEPLEKGTGEILVLLSLQ